STFTLKAEAFKGEFEKKEEKPSLEMIVEFFENREIFITGGSGVVGKALIEKLLRSCNVKKIYVLLRAKKNVPIEERLEKIKQEMVRNTWIEAP
ncbi:hypothetical protein DOY81_011237, partial [Sarcophaga bullata]